ncbi:MAG: tRNA lysidine(34) synthetase TilS [Clostridia bacterium]|nr:tRNA lysidine(34) synthetase TilS [Clostridia bacterium]
MTDFLKIYDKFKSAAAGMKLISEGDAVLAAVSGGRDSVALLLLLKKLAADLPDLYIGVFHYDHSLRGRESDGDALYVNDLAKRLKLPFFSEKGDVAKYASENKLSLETAARELRYKAMRNAALSIANETGRTVKTAVAHTSEDRAETVFLNIVRGTSVDGLEGIRYRNGDIIRPLLDLTKEDVETVCRESGENYRTDSTNFERIGKRNIARLDVFPFIDKAMDCNITERLLSLSKLSAEDSDYLTAEADRVFPDCVEISEKGDAVLSAGRITALHPSISSRVIRKAISLVENSEGKKPFKDCVSVSTDMVVRAEGFICGGRGILELGKSVYCVGNGPEYYLTSNRPKGTTETPDIFAEIPPVMEGVRLFTWETDGGKTAVLTVRTLAGALVKEALKKSIGGGETAAAFDLDELTKLAEEKGGTLTVRNPGTGDRIRPFGLDGSKTLGKFLTDRKIPAARRSGVVILALGKEVLHVFGVRRSGIAPVTENTSRCLCLELKIN